MASASHYDVLGVETSATDRDIKVAYRDIAALIHPDKCSEEKKAAIRAYGAELLISPPGACYMQMETDLADENPDWFSVDQYNNLDNPNGHYRSTGPEIYEQTDGEVTHFVAAGSTGHLLWFGEL